LSPHPLHHLRVPLICEPITHVRVPRAAVLPRPHQHSRFPPQAAYVVKKKIWIACLEIVRNRFGRRGDQSPCIHGQSEKKFSRSKKKTTSCVWGGPSRAAATSAFTPLRTAAYAYRTALRAGVQTTPLSSLCLRRPLRRRPPPAPPFPAMPALLAILFVAAATLATAVGPQTRFPVQLNLRRFLRVESTSVPVYTLAASSSPAWPRVPFPAQPECLIIVNHAAPRRLSGRPPYSFPSSAQLEPFSSLKPLTSSGVIPTSGSLFASSAAAAARTDDGPTMNRRYDTRSAASAAAHAPRSPRAAVVATDALPVPTERRALDRQPATIELPRPSCC